MSVSTFRGNRAYVRSLRACSIATLVLLSLLAPRATAQDDAGVDAGASEADAGVPDAGVAEEPHRPVMVPPRLTEAPPIELPPDAEPLPPEASIELLVTITAEGTVSDAQIATPLREDVDALALEAARQMRFDPATRDGTPIPARIRFRYRISVAEPERAEGSEASEAGSEAGSESGTGSGSGSGSESGSGSGSGSESGSGSGSGEEEEEAPEESLASFGAEAIVDRAEAGAASRITLTGAELTTVPGTLGEPLRVVATLPGVARSPFGLGFFLVRGAAFQNTGFFVDGFPVPILYHFGAGPAVLSSRLVTRLRFYPGGYPVNYGRYSAGIIALDTGMPEGVHGPHVEAEVDLLRASLLAAVPFDDGRGSIVAAFRRSYYELLLPLFVQGLYIAYTDYQLRAEYRFDRYFSASVFIFGSDDVLDQSGAIGMGATTEGTNTSFSIQFQRAIARLRWALPNDGTLTIAGAIGRDANAFGSQQAGTATQRFETESFNLGLRVDAILPLEPWLRLNAGLDLAATSFGVNITAPLSTGLGEYPRPRFDPQLVPISATVARSTPGAYGELVFQLDPVEVSIGIRADLLRWGSLTDIAPDPRAVVRWQIVPEVLVKAATGLFYQPPIAFQTISQGGNPRLGPQRAWQSSLGVELDLPESIEVEVTGFYSQMFDIARFSQRIVNGVDGTPQREFFRADQEGRAWGLEVLLRRPVEQGFYGWLSYTLSRSERQNLSGNWVPFTFDQTHVLNVAASYAFDGWRFGVRYQLASGRPTSSVCSVQVDADSDAYDANFCDRGERLPVYHQLDVRIDRDFDLGSIRGTIYLDVLNVYYAQNSEGLVYQYDFARSAQVPGLPILGTLGIRAMYE